MINITIKYKSTGEFDSLVSQGHADSAPYGQDLVCAAVSGVLLGGINALKGKNYSLKNNDKKGILELRNIGNISERDSIVIDTMVLQLQAIERDNPKFIKISIE